MRKRVLVGASTGAGVYFYSPWVAITKCNSHPHRKLRLLFALGAAICENSGSCGG